MTEQDEGVGDERVSWLDDRLLHMTRDEARAHLDEYLAQRGLAIKGDAVPGSEG
jgi:hypothetical protein